MLKGMLLYHGTTAAVGEKAKREGLKPRRLTNARTTYPAMPSHPDCVYLTTIYAGVAVLLACGRPEVEGAIIEVNAGHLNRELLLPDEDVVEKITRHPRAGTSQKALSKRIQHIRKRLADHRDLLGQSLSEGGRCAYKGIVPVSAITRIVCFPLPKGHPVFRLLADVGQKKLRADAHREELAFCNRWFFGDPIEEDARVLGVPLVGLPREGFRVETIVPDQADESDRERRD